MKSPVVASRRTANRPSSVSQRSTVERDSWRFRILWGVTIFIFVLVIGRAFLLQVVQHKFLQAKADAMVLSVDTIPAHRGMLLDRFGTPLAISTPLTTLWLDPKEYLQQKAEMEDTQAKLRKDPNSKSLKLKLPKTNFDLGALALAVGIDPNQLNAQIQSKPRSRYLSLKRQMRPEDADVVMSRKFQSVYKQTDYQRYYPQAQPNAQILGLTNRAGKGIEGLEANFDEALTGHDGKMRVMHDKQGNRIKDVDLIESERPGEDVKLSIDGRIQYIMYRELAASGIANNARSATAVALDPQTGEVLAMASWPSYNPNDPDGLNNKDAMRNRAVIDSFEPGSTMKPFTISAALESGKYQPFTQVNTSPGSLTIAGHTIHDHGNNGMLDLKGIIVKSSNVGAAKIALSLPSNTLPLFYERIGFGKKTTLGFPGESRGLILPEKLWNPAEVATMSYGYGINVSLIQLAQGYATIAAGGVQHPVTLRKVEGTAPGKRLFDEKIASEVITMMEGVTAPGGTAKQAAIPGYRVAGKTGTAHKLRPDGRGYSETEYRGLFVGLAPASHPRIVIAVVVENPVGQYYGGLVAAPIFAKIMTESLRLMNVPMDKSLAVEKKAGK
ncbi:peptidoglycan D,D-transpeptidase FtsI family protein [Aquirhabdus sp.]|uniref:peptidoglycan D,D-transpeptidase FtsI family protein n=1 Tax=Aquirhabdus sp. TaxID=2824160 RepID=UPI00396C3350